MSINGIWDSQYVQVLGILDHAREILIINDEIVSLKNQELPTWKLNESFFKECADLYIILSKYFCRDIDEAKGIIKDRLERFAEKAAKENKGDSL